MPGLTVDNYVGRVLGDRYRLISPVGSGASATVYTADDQSLERRVAVKVLHANLVNDPRFAKRFRNEAKAVAQLSHPRILAVYDWAEGDEAYIVTELLSGGSLRHMLDEGHRLSVSQALVVGLHALEGLEAAHAGGFVHRDIKPANLLFGADGRLRIADFGIARAVAEAAWTEPEGALIGTARYAAPEQGSGAKVTGAADIYSLCLTLVEAVTGEVPLLGDSPIATMVLRQDISVEVPAELGPLWESLTAAGRARPDDRPAAAELIRAFHRAASDLPRPYVLPLANLDADAPARLDYPDTTGPGSVEADGANSGGSGPVDLTAPASTPLHFADDDLAALGMASGEQPAVDPERRGELEEFDVDRRVRWPWGVMAVAVATLLTALVSSWAFQSDPRAVPLPRAIDGPALGEFVGLDEAAARGLIEQEGWNLAVVRQRRSGTVSGEVLAQNPIPGNTWAPGQVVTLLVSDGPPLVDVPELVGIDRREAAALLRALGLGLGEVTEVHDEEVAADLVVAASAAAGSALPEGEQIDLQVSLGPERRQTPDLRGLTLDDATAALAALDVGLEVVGDDYSVDVAEGSIISSQPLPLALVDKGGTVEVIVSLGKPFVTIPRTQGQEVDRATARLEEVGLVVIGVEGAPNRPVLYTDPPPGESVRMGTEVLIYTRR